MSLKNYRENLKRRYALVYPEKRPEEEVRNTEKRTRRYLLLLAAACLTLLLITALTGAFRGEEAGSYERPEPWEADLEDRVEAMVEGEAYSVEVFVGSREYTEAEKQKILENAESELLEKLPGDNPSLDRVYLDLVFSDECEPEGVQVSWTPFIPELIGWDGCLAPEAVKEGSVNTSILLELEFLGVSRSRLISITLIPAPREAASFPERLQAAVLAANDTPDGTVRLPGTVEGKQVSYRKGGSEGGWLWILAMGLLVSAAVLLLPEQRLKEAEEQRRRALELSYSELASKLSVLLGAGLSVRGAWEKMTSDYEKKRAAGGQRSPLYEEMCLARRTFHQGRTEEEAYGQFAQRVGLTAYLRLGSLLESSRKNGRAELRFLLAAEAEEAFRNRLELAKKQGEEISSRLMLPLMLLFGLVLAVTAAPAFLSW